MLILICIITFLCLIYAMLLLYLWWGTIQLKKQIRQEVTQNSIAKNLSLSIILPLRNEENNALTTLQALANQDYKGVWEVWCINDRSTDRTGAILEEFAITHPQFKILHISEEMGSVASPKKRALKMGFAQATGDILLTTDADCIPPKHWLTSMANQFSDNIGIVQGPKEIIGENTPITLYQKLETLGFASIEAATFALGRPMLASAPSLAYKRSLFEAVGGFSGLEHLVSGDDDMLVHKMAQHPEGNVRYNISPNASVCTPAVHSWKQLLSQRARWASNGTKYENKAFVALLFVIFSFYLWLFLGPLFSFLEITPWSLWLVPFILKYIFDGLFLYTSAKLFHRTSWLKHLIWVQWFNIPIFVIASIMGYFGCYKWK